MALNTMNISESVAAGGYPGLELDDQGDVTLLVTVPDNVAAHYRRVNAQPKQTLEMSLAHVSEKTSSCRPRFRALFAQMTEQSHVDESGAGSHERGHQMVGLCSDDGLSSLIILIAIYGRHGLLPHSIPPMLLARLAAKANQHQCSEAIAPIVKPSISQAMKEHRIPNTVNRTLEVWLMIASTFKHQESFAEATRNCIASSSGTIQPQHVAMPQHLYESLVADGAATMRVPLKRSARVGAKALGKNKIEVKDRGYKALVTIVDGGV
ncbi:hypothetical protein ASPCAL13968 [Aspergillus calidoustus]|uniref:BTB domain-containing protein n=1 Tax=Aspergillus calidoustus TaxID=454130 RepID=A0A0U5CIS4_ASPCI|nr:hypothetical protein ASPCAL13968 [Aspergillus calidoustus]